MSGAGTVNKCPHPKCDKQKPHGHFACKPHWFSLPIQLRLRISLAWSKREMATWLQYHDEAVQLWKAGE